MDAGDMRVDFCFKRGSDEPTQLPSFSAWPLSEPRRLYGSLQCSLKPDEAKGCKGCKPWHVVRETYTDCGLHCQVSRNSLLYALAAAAQWEENEAAQPQKQSGQHLKPETRQGS